MVRQDAVSDTAAAAPAVSIGMPIYNAERYLRGALDAIIGQTFVSFELIIADNASTDRTDEICAEYAARDSRIRYYRNPSNIGLAANFRRVFDLARSPLFKWAAYDDLIAPTFLERCVEVLRRHPEFLLCHSRTRVIDEHGAVLIHHPHDDLDIGAASPSTRFNEMIRVYHWCPHQYGVIRREVLARTDLVAPYPQSDRVLLAHLALLGPMAMVDEPLFSMRKHAAGSVASFNATHSYALAWMLDPSRRGRAVLPVWRLLFELWGVIGRANLAHRDRLWCRVHLVIWTLRGINSARLARDLVRAAGFTLFRAGNRISDGKA